MISESQFFYGALWWLAALPGGAVHAPAVAQRHGKAPVTFPPCEIKRGRKEVDPFSMSWEEIDELEDQKARGFNPADEILPPEKLDVFFDTLLTALKNSTALEYTANGNRRYMELSQSCATGSTHPAYPDFPFSDELEEAIAAAGISRHALPQKTVLYMHDDGQIFVPVQNGDKQTMQSFSYPERPALPCRSIQIDGSDMDHCPRLTWETLYRVVPLKPGQTFQSGWFSVKGERVSHEETVRRDNQVLVIGNNDVQKLEDLWTLTDQEIIDFHPSLRGSFNDSAASYQPGFRTPSGRISIEASDKPNIVRQLIPNIAYMVAKETVQFGCGSLYNIARPGDFIIRDGGYPRVMAKELLENGRVRFILPQAQPGGPRPH